jgi:hypothetical protein
MAAMIKTAAIRQTVPRSLFFMCALLREWKTGSALFRMDYFGQPEARIKRYPELTEHVPARGDRIDTRRRDT